MGPWCHSRVPESFECLTCTIDHLQSNYWPEPITCSVACKMHSWICKQTDIIHLKCPSTPYFTLCGLTFTTACLSAAEVYVLGMLWPSCVRYLRALWKMMGGFFNVHFKENFPLRENIYSIRFHYIYCNWRIFLLQKLKFSFFFPPKIEMFGISSFQSALLLVQNILWRGNIIVAN